MDKYKQRASNGTYKPLSDFAPVYSPADLAGHCDTPSALLTRLKVPLSEVGFGGTSAVIMDPTRDEDSYGVFWPGLWRYGDGNHGLPMVEHVALKYKVNGIPLTTSPRGFGVVPTIAAPMFSHKSGTITYSSTNRRITFTPADGSTPQYITGGPIILLQLIGGGGGGAGGCYFKHYFALVVWHDYSYARGGSGGGGGSTLFVFIKLSDNLKLEISVGAGGAGGSAGSESTSGGAGKDGGDTEVTFYGQKSDGTWVKSTPQVVVKAPGGKGAAATPSAADIVPSLPGAGGAPLAYSEIPTGDSEFGAADAYMEIIGVHAGSDGGYGGRAQHPKSSDDLREGVHAVGTVGSHISNGAVELYYDTGKLFTEVNGYATLGTGGKLPAYPATYSSKVPLKNSCSAGGGNGGVAPTITSNPQSVGGSSGMYEVAQVIDPQYGGGGAGGYSSCEDVPNHTNINCGAGNAGADGAWFLWAT